MTGARLAACSSLAKLSGVMSCDCGMASFEGRVDWAEAMVALQSQRLGQHRVIEFMMMPSYELGAAATRLLALFIASFRELTRAANTNVALRALSFLGADQTFSSRVSTLISGRRRRNPNRALRRRCEATGSYGSKAKCKIYRCLHNSSSNLTKVSFAPRAEAGADCEKCPWQWLKRVKPVVQTEHPRFDHRAIRRGFYPHIT